MYESMMAYSCLSHCRDRSFLEDFRGYHLDYSHFSKLIEADYSIILNSTLFQNRFGKSTKSRIQLWETV